MVSTDIKVYKALNHRLSNVGGFRHPLRCWNIAFTDNVGVFRHKWAFRTWDCHVKDADTSGSGEWIARPCLRLRGNKRPYWVRLREMARLSCNLSTDVGLKLKTVCAKSTKHSFLFLDNFMFMSLWQRPFHIYNMLSIWATGVSASKGTVYTITCFNYLCPSFLMSHRSQ